MESPVARSGRDRRYWHDRKHHRTAAPVRHMAFANHRIPRGPATARGLFPAGDRWRDLVAGATAWRAGADHGGAPRRGWPAKIHVARAVERADHRARVRWAVLPAGPR